jgi:hypothetical protein
MLRIAAVLGAAVLIVPAVALAADGDKATGGGQVLFSSSDAKRSTITFTAQQKGEDVKGQVNIIDRTAGSGQDQQHIKGTVECITVMGNMAQIGGFLNDEDETPFHLRVTDNGEGENAGNDMIEYDTIGEDGDCEQNGMDDSPEIVLANGNVQVHKQKPSSAKKSSATKTGLRVLR